MRKITCLCEHSFEIDFPDSIDLSVEPEIQEKILCGDFMTIRCPQCNTELKPELPFRLSDGARNLEIFFIPEPDRSAYLMGKLEYETGDPARIVIGYKELVEKLLIFQAELDDRVVETLKYYILSKARTTEHASDICIYFHGKQNDKLIFHIEGLKQDEIARYDLNFSSYEKAYQDLENKEQEATFASFLAPPYVSLNKVYME